MHNGNEILLVRGMIGEHVAKSEDVVFPRKKAEFLLLSKDILGSSYGHPAFVGGPWVRPPLPQWETPVAILLLQKNRES